MLKSITLIDNTQSYLYSQVEKYKQIWNKSCKYYFIVYFKIDCVWRQSQG